MLTFDAQSQQFLYKLAKALSDVLNENDDRWGVSALSSTSWNITHPEIPLTKNSVNDPEPSVLEFSVERQDDARWMAFAKDNISSVENDSPKKLTVFISNDAPGPSWDLDDIAKRSAQFFIQEKDFMKNQAIGQNPNPPTVPAQSSAQSGQADSMNMNPFARRLHRLAERVAQGPQHFSWKTYLRNLFPPSKKQQILNFERQNPQGALQGLRQFAKNLLTQRRFAPNLIQKIDQMIVHLHSRNVPVMAIIDNLGDALQTIAMVGPRVFSSKQMDLVLDHLFFEDFQRTAAGALPGRDRLIVLAGADLREVDRIIGKLKEGDLKKEADKLTELLLSYKNMVAESSGTLRKNRI